MGYRFVSENLKKTGVIIDGQGIDGSRSHRREQTRTAHYDVAGSITMNPSPEELDNLFPMILGGTESADSFPLADALPQRAIAIDRVGRRFIYDTCTVSRATFSGRHGEPIQLVMELIGDTETVSATAMPAITYTTATNGMYVPSDNVVTVLSSARSVLSWEIIIDNHVSARFVNSTTANDISATDRTVMFNYVVPYTSSEVDLYAQALDHGATATLVLTNGGYSTTFTFARLQAPDNSPVVPGRSEITLAVQSIARMNSTTKELAVTHDSVA